MEKSFGQLFHKNAWSFKSFSTKEDQRSKMCSGWPIVSTHNLISLRSPKQETEKNNSNNNPKHEMQLVKEEDCHEILQFRTILVTDQKKMWAKFYLPGCLP